MRKKNQRIWEGFPEKMANELDLEGAAETVGRGALEAKSLLRRGNNMSKAWRWEYVPREGPVSIPVWLMNSGAGRKKAGKRASQPAGLFCRRHGGVAVGEARKAGEWWDAHTARVGANRTWRDRSRWEITGLESTRPPVSFGLGSPSVSA